MIKRITICLFLTAFITVEASAQRHRNRNGGALLGGLAGAALGAVIGDKGDNETAGALIGGAVGAVAGGTIGNQKDQRIQHNRRYHSRQQQQYLHPQNGSQYGANNQHHQQYYRARTYPAPALPVVGPTTHPGQQSVLPQDVVNMVRSGWRESMIIQQVQLRGMQRQLSITEVLKLHEMGVSEPILIAMQEAAPIVVNQQMVSQQVVSQQVISDNAASEQLPLPPPPVPYGPSIMAPKNGSK
jgi:hypothetical protein